MSLKDSSPDSSNKNIITNTKMLLFVGQSKNPDQKAISESMHQFNKIYALVIHMQQTLNGIRALLETNTNAWKVDFRTI